jgi:hypothetical protein
MTDYPIQELHNWLWILFDMGRTLLAISPYIGLFSILSLVFAGLGLAISHQHKEQQKQAQAEEREEEDS